MSTDHVNSPAGTAEDFRNSCLSSALTIRVEECMTWYTDESSREDKLSVLSPRGGEFTTLTGVQ